ncbi:hypothetical protein HAX54_042239, partial [Datura stramonium]|nr:hypothetical protein [Datura stramonium]
MYGESTKIKVRGQVVQFTSRSLNAFPGMPVVDPEMYFMMLEKPPYHEIYHNLCGEHSASQWARGTHTTEITLESVFLREVGIEEEEGNLHLPLAGHLE